MADQPNEGRQVQLRIDEQHMETTYANTIRTATTMDEVVLDFGLNLPMQGGQGQDPYMVFSIGSRVVLNWSGAKRLMLTLNQAVGAYEQRHGEIQVGRPGGAPPQGEQSGGEG